MANQKRSFLDKLTGSKSASSGRDTTQQQAPMPVYEEEETPVGMHVEESAPQGQNFPVQQQSFPPQTPNASFSQNQEQPSWQQPAMSQQQDDQQDDAEGQLTIDVYQTDTEIVIKSTIAGVKPEDLDVAINNDMVTVKGERSMEEEVEADDYFYQECYWGAFSRSVVLPVDVVADKAEASLKNGILTVRLPKADTTIMKKIQVRGF